MLNLICKSVLFKSVLSKNIKLFEKDRLICDENIREQVSDITADMISRHCEKK